MKKDLIMTVHNEGVENKENPVKISLDGLDEPSYPKEVLDEKLSKKADLLGGKVPAEQLPSYVDDVQDVPNYESLPETGEDGILYCTKDTGDIYRWTGTMYVKVGGDNVYFTVKVDSEHIVTMGELRTFINNINNRHLHCLFDLSSFLTNSFICTVLMFSNNETNYALLFDINNGRTYINYSGYEDSETVVQYLLNNDQDIPRVIPVIESDIKVSEVKTLLDNINGLDHHVLFDLSIFHAKSNLCGISFENTNKITILDLNNALISYQEYDNTTLLSAVVDNFIKLGASSDDKLDKNNSKGTGYIAYNKAEGSSPGSYSAIFGKDCIATREYSHAAGQDNETYSLCSHIEGHNNTLAANCDYSHVEGNNNQARQGKCMHVEGEYNTCTSTSGSSKGDYSHVEGQNNMLYDGKYSHVEGCDNHICANYCHVEGDHNYAYGSYSHVEGEHNYAYGSHSHVEGYRNITNNYAEAAFGRYNKSIQVSTTFGDAGNTLFTIGNGTTGKSDENRKNAFAVYQDGHAVVQTMGTEDNAVATKKYVDDTFNLSVQHLINVSATTSQGTWRYQFSINAPKATTFTQLMQIAAYLHAKQPGIRIPVSGTYTENSDVYLVVGLEVISATQVRAEMYKAYDGAYKAIETGVVDITDLKL